MTPSSVDFFERSPIPMLVIDGDTHEILKVNPAAIAFYGYEALEFLQMTLKNLEVEGAVQLHGKEMKTHLKKDGDVVYVNVIINPLKHLSKERYVCLIIDFTESIHNERITRESAERFNIVSKATSDTIWDYNLSTAKIIWNRGIKGIFGHQDVIENTTNCDWWHHHIHADDRDDVIAQMDHHLTMKISRWTTAYRFRCGDGTYRYVLDRYFTVFDDDGNPARIIAAMEDMTIRKQYKQAIDEQNRRFKEIAWIQSHLVRAPLARIMALVDLIKDNEKDDEEYNRILEYLSSSAKELDAVIIEIADKTPDV